MTKKEELKVQIIRRQQLHTAHTNLKYFGFTGIRDSVPVSNLLGLIEIFVYFIH
jgi:hypothetical protein